MSTQPVDNKERAEKIRKLSDDELVMMYEIYKVGIQLRFLSLLIAPRIKTSLLCFLRKTTKKPNNQTFLPKIFNRIGKLYLPKRFRI